MSLIIKEINNHIAWLTINRPETMNAMNEEVIKELESAIHSSVSNDSVGVIIISGSGDKAFIAGADIKKMQKMKLIERDFRNSGSNIFHVSSSFFCVFGLKNKLKHFIVCEIKSIYSTKHFEHFYY